MTNQATNPTCPECGHPTVRDVRPFTVAYKGLSSTVNMPGWYCTNCDEAIVVGKDMDEADRELHRLKAQAENLLLPEEIRRIRKKLRLTQEEAGVVLGGGPNAFNKYEKGSVLPSHAISNLLRLLEVHPGGLEVLNARKSPVDVNERKRPRARDGANRQIATPAA
jgi:HTH-type transcriptional regulator / antitoxin MqsA